MFRGLVLHGVRQIDADDSSPGIARPVTIYYAAPLEPVYEAMWRAARFLRDRELPAAAAHRGRRWRCCCGAGWRRSKS